MGKGKIETWQGMAGRERNPGVFGAEGVEKEGIRPCLGGFQDPETLVLPS